MPTGQVRALAIGQRWLSDLKAMLDITARTSGGLQQVHRFLVLPGSVLTMVEMCLPFL